MLKQGNDSLLQYQFANKFIQQQKHAEFPEIMAFLKITSMRIYEHFVVPNSDFDIISSHCVFNVDDA